MNKIEIIRNLGFEYHHTATERGYVSRKVECVVKQYVGRFGIGFKVLQPRFDSTQYVKCTYFIYDNYSKPLNVIIYDKKYNDIAFANFPLIDFKSGKNYYYLTDISELTLKLEKDRYDIRLEDWDKICD